MRALNALERLGWPVLASERLGMFSGEARVLCELVMNPDRVMTLDQLHSQLRVHNRAPTFNVRKALPPRMAMIRIALADVGIDGQAIECVSDSPVKPCLGYRVRKDAAEKIRGFVGA